MKYLQIYHAVRITTFALLMSTNYFMQAMELEGSPVAPTTSDHVSYTLKEFDFKNHLPIGFKMKLSPLKHNVHYELDAIMGNIVTSDTNVYFVGRFRFCFAPEKKDFLTSLGVKKEKIPSYVYGFVEIAKTTLDKLIRSSDQKKRPTSDLSENQKKQLIHQVVNDLVTTDTTTPANYYEKAGKLSCRLQYYSINGIRDSKTHGTTRTKKQIDGYFYDMTHDPLFQPDSENDIPSLLLGQPFVPREKDESVKFLLPMISHSKLQLFRISNDEQKTSSFQPLFEKPIRNHNSRPYIIRHITYEKNDYILTSSGYANTLMTKISKENEKPFEFENAYLLDTAAKRVFIASPSTSAFTHKLNLKLFKYVEKDLCIYERGFPQILQYPKHFQEILNSNSNETYRIQSYQFFEEMPVIATTVNHVLYMFQTGSSGDLTTENKELLLNQARDLFINQNDNDDTINMKLLASRITYPYILKNNNKLYLLDPSDEPRTEQQEKTIDKNVLAFIHLKPDDQKKLFKDTTNLKTAKEKSFAIHNAMHQFVALDETSFLVDKYDKLYLLTLKSAEEMAREEQELLKKQKEHEIEQDNVKKMIRHEPQTAQKKIEQLKEKLKKKEAELQNDQENEKPNGKEIKRLTREIAALQKKIKEEEDNL